MSDEKSLIIYFIIAVISLLLGKGMVSWSYYLSQEYPQEAEPFIKTSKPVVKSTFWVVASGLLPLLPATVVFMNKQLDWPLILSIYVIALFLWQVVISDLHWQLIFDKQMALLAVLGLIRVLLGDYNLVDHIGAGLIVGCIFFLLAIVTRGGFGGGDIKLLAVLGLWLGSDLLLRTVVLGILFGGLGALGLLIGKKRNRKDFFPYGPFFAISALLCFMFRLLEL